MRSRSEWSSVARQSLARSCANARRPSSPPHPPCLRIDVSGGHVRKVQPLPVGIETAHGHQIADAAFGLTAVGQASAPVATAADRQGRLVAIHAAAAAGDQIDDTEHRVASIHRGARPTDHFDPFDQIEVEGQRGVDRHAGVDVLVHAHAVDEHLEALPVVARRRHAAHPGVGIGVVVGNGEALQRAQHIGKGAPAEGPDVGGGHDGDGGRRVLGVFGELGCRQNAHLRQLLQRHVDSVEPGRRHRRQGQQRAGAHRAADEACERTQPGEKGERKMHHDADALQEFPAR